MFHYEQNANLTHIHQQERIDEGERSPEVIRRPLHRTRRINLYGVVEDNKIEILVLSETVERLPRCLLDLPDLFALHALEQKGSNAGVTSAEQR